MLPFHMQFCPCENNYTNDAEEFCPDKQPDSILMQWTRNAANTAAFETNILAWDVMSPKGKWQMQVGKNVANSILGNYVCISAHPGEQIVLAVSSRTQETSCMPHIVWHFREVVGTCSEYRWLESLSLQPGLSFWLSFYWSAWTLRWASECLYSTKFWAPTSLNTLWEIWRLTRKPTPSSTWGGIPHSTGSLGGIMKVAMTTIQEIVLLAPAVYPVFQSSIRLTKDAERPCTLTPCSVWRSLMTCSYPMGHRTDTEIQMEHQRLT